MKYSEKLKNPKWQKKRLEILNRDEFTCQKCGDTENTLHIHHIAYNKDPWDAPNNLLTTLCEECHSIETEWLKQVKTEMFANLKESGFMALSFYNLSDVFKDTDRGWAFYEPAFSILKMIVDDDDAWEMATKLFYDKIREK